MEKPASYNEDLMTDWSLWVLDHDLPDLPAAVPVGESVPVARWAGPRFGAVLHLQWSWRDDHDDDAYLMTEIQVFRRDADGRWEAAMNTGGSDWAAEWPLTRPDVPPDYAELGGQFYSGERDWSFSAFDGQAGVNAALVEVADADGVTSRPIDSPLGIVLAAVDGSQPARIRVLDADGRVLATRNFAGWLPPSANFVESCEENG